MIQSLLIKERIYVEKKQKVFNTKNEKLNFLKEHKRFFKKFVVKNDQIPYKPKPNRIWMPRAPKSTDLCVKSLSHGFMNASSVNDPRDC